MAFSLIDDTDSAAPISALTKAEFPSWLEAAPERERNWLTSTGFSAEAGKHALVPGETGRLARVLVGLGSGADGDGRMWALAGLPAALPEASYRLDAVPGGVDPTNLALETWTDVVHLMFPARFEVNRCCPQDKRTY